jgi:serine O-acetyltransferase
VPGQAIEMRTTLTTDLLRYLGEKPLSPSSAIHCVMFDFGLQATLVYRLGRALHLRRRRPLWMIPAILGWPVYFVLAFLVRRLYGIHLGLSADIGRGLYVGHFGGIRVVNCRLGDFVTVGEQNRIGTDASTDGPVIGNRVWLGGHVHVLGPVRIGDGATISSGALVTSDVPRATLIAGRPGRPLSLSYDNTRILGSGVPG